MHATYIPDFICFDQVIVEIKATTSVTDKFRAQIIHYLKATNKRVGLLVNFGSDSSLHYERFVN